MLLFSSNCSKKNFISRNFHFIIFGFDYHTSQQQLYLQHALNKFSREMLSKMSWKSCEISQCVCKFIWLCLSNPHEAITRRNDNKLNLKWQKTSFWLLPKHILICFGNAICVQNVQCNMSYHQLLSNFYPEVNLKLECNEDINTRTSHD